MALLEHVECYMKDHGMAVEEDAMPDLAMMVEQAWRIKIGHFIYDFYVIYYDYRNVDFFQEISWNNPNSGYSYFQPNYTYRFVGVFTAALLNNKKKINKVSCKKQGGQSILCSLCNVYKMLYSILLQTNLIRQATYTTLVCRR
jgi:hypothetical protein